MGKRHTKAVRKIERHKLRLIRTNFRPVGYSAASCSKADVVPTASADFSPAILDTVPASLGPPGG